MKRALAIIASPSLKQRLTAGVFFLTLVLLTLACGLASYGSHRYAQNHYRSILSAVSSELLEEMEPSDSAEDDFPEMVEEIQEAAAHTSERLMVLHVSGQEVRGRSHLDGPTWPGGEEGDWMLTVLPFHGDQLVAALYFGEVRARLKGQALVLVGLSGGVLLLVTLGTWHLVGATLSPIERLSRQARSAGSAFETRLEAPSHDTEITELVTTLNQFLGRLTEASAARSRFYAAASHELRTPLQALSGHLELALNKERDAEEYRAALREAQAQSQRLIRLTEDLLILNRLEVGSSDRYEVVDLADHCENEWMYLQGQAREKGLLVDCALPQHLELKAPPNYLSVLFRNLLENAVKYAREGGRLAIKLGSSEAPSRARLTIFNECDPIATSDFEKLGEPFFRPDPSRQSRTGGNGLGLAIARSIAAQEGWTLRLQQVEKGFLSEVIF